MFLIADSGSSKTDWRLTDNKKVLSSLHTEGLNPYYKTIEEMKSVLQRDLIPHLPCKPEDITHIYFYGAGCSVPYKCQEVKKALSACFSIAKIEVEHDILGAARACSVHDKGIVCILGTGSNSCYYDGNDIIEIIGGLGFLMGDEGSGCHIGKTIVAAYLNHELPEELKTDFYNTYHLDRAAIDKKVYLEPNANRFLASFSMFAEKHKTHPFIIRILNNCFELYLDKHVCRYSNFTESITNFVGSVAFYNQDLLKNICRGKSIKTGKFILHPVDALVEFHSGNTL